VKALRILALMHEDLVPPEDASSQAAAEADWKMEFDVTVSLKKLGHEVQNLGVGGDLGVIRKAIDEGKPHIVLNLLEHFHGIPVFDQNVVSYLELLRIPYTGCNPRGLMLARDKGLSKKLLAYHRIPVPEFAVFPLGGGKVRRPKRLQFPLIVKSLTREASTGISQASVVEDDASSSNAPLHPSSSPPMPSSAFHRGRSLYAVCSATALAVFPVWSCCSPRCRISSGTSPPTA
jgi:D-alanine-D-alanine ligase